jgi:uncharacterized protein (DUF58 family)
MSTLIRILKQPFQRQRIRIYILPTRFGWMLALFLVVMLLGAINYSNSMGHLLVFLLASLVHTAMLHTHRNVNHLNIQHCHAEPVFCGQAAHFHIVLKNDRDQDKQQVELSRRPPSQNRRFFGAFRGFESHTLIPHIPALASVDTTLNIPTSRRGYQPLGTVKLSTTFPLGLFTSWHQHKTDAKVLVFPRPLGDLPIPTTHAIGESANTTSDLGDDDFAGLRPYREGDTKQRIAWKKAQQSQLETKQFHATSHGQRCLSWADTQGDVETRLSQLSAWLVKSDQDKVATRLELPNQVIDYGIGDKHLQICLTALATYDFD